MYPPKPQAISHRNSQQMDLEQKNPGFYAAQGQAGSMPSLMHRQFRLESGASGGSSNGDKSAAGSKVWGNSVLSANFEAPVDNEEDDEFEVRRIAAQNSLRQGHPPDDPI